MGIFLSRKRIKTVGVVEEKISAKQHAPNINLTVGKHVSDDGQPIGP